MGPAIRSVKGLVASLAMVAWTVSAEEGCPHEFGITFDIDGVLLHGTHPIPGANKTLQKLHDDKIAHVLLTNGGGKTEDERVADLNEHLGIDTLISDNFCQSHTPYKDMPEYGQYKNKTILVFGQHPQRARKIFEEYGYQTVVTACDLLTAQPKLWSFAPSPEDAEVAACAQPLPRPINPSDPAHSLKIDAVFSINDARWWHMDIQFLLDTQVSAGGVIGTVSAKNGDERLPNRGWLQDGQPRLHFSANDLEYSNGWPVPRLGCGAFMQAFLGVWRDKTAGLAAEPDYDLIGKPTHYQYSYVENMQMRNMDGVTGGRHCPLKRNYMVGDNPLTDIKGANEYKSVHNTTWNSILVATGVWDGRSEPAVEPTKRVEDVVAAVKWIYEQEGISWVADF